MKYNGLISAQISFPAQWDHVIHDSCVINLMKVSQAPCPFSSCNCNVPPSQTRETLEWLSSHYFTARVSSTEVASFGLYPRWREYVPYLATFLGYLARRTIIQTASVCKNGDVTPQQGTMSKPGLNIQYAFICKTGKGFSREILWK